LYAFLEKRARSRRSFTIKDIMNATGWPRSTAKTYVGKQVTDLVERRQERFVVRREFLRLSQEVFLKLVSQKEYILPHYRRVAYESLVTYEFLLPLTKEDTLRRRLDELFYRDTLEERLRQIDPAKLKKAVEKHAKEKKEDYIRRAAEVVSQLFSGYSITHVNGRFLAASLATRHDAVGLAVPPRYARLHLQPHNARAQQLHHETRDSHKHWTKDWGLDKCSRVIHGEAFDPAHEVCVDKQKLENDIARIRILFFNVFAEAVANAVLHEDEIWLLETAASQSRLYTWEKGE